jgi:PAS domain S-box-containing protein
METVHEKKDYQILVIEDNPGDFALVEEFLLSELESPVIFNATDCQMAGEFLSDYKYQFDIILLDLSLPDKNGEPLILEIIENCGNAPVIVLTGYADFKFGIKSLALGVSDYILKDELTSLSLYKSIIYSSERKKIVSALAESEKKYSELFHLSPLPMYVFELETLKFMDVNEACIRHYGYTTEEFLQMDLKTIRPPEEIPALEQGLLTGSPDRRNDRMDIYKHRKKNGEIIQVDIQSNLIEFRGKNAKVTIATDVTERLSYIKAIEAQSEKMKEISWIQSHVVRAPLARIMGLLPMVKDLNEPSDEREKMFEYLISSADELDELIKTITDKTRMADYQILPK